MKATRMDGSDEECEEERGGACVKVRGTSQTSAFDDGRTVTVTVTVTMGASTILYRPPRRASYARA